MPYKNRPRQLHYLKIYLFEYRQGQEYRIQRKSYDHKYYQKTCENQKKVREKEEIKAETARR